MNLYIVISALNEEKSIANVIKGLRKEGYKNILVVDDGSKDNTFLEAKKEGAQVLRHIVNRGLGAGLGTAFAFAKSVDADIVVTFDADGQHDPKEIKRLIAPIQKDLADVVIGSRLSDSELMPLDRKILNWCANVFTYLLFKVWTTDSQSGFRAFNKKALNCIKIMTDRMEVSSEFFKEIHKNSLRFTEIPIKAIYTQESLKGSKQEKFASAKIAFKLMLRFFR